MIKQRNHGRGKDSTQISFSLPQKLSDRIDAFAVKDQRNRSNTLVYLLTQALDIVEKRNMMMVACPASGRGQKTEKAS